METRSMSGFREYVENSNFMLTEVKLSRVWKHLTDEDAVVGIITAFRGEFPYDKNKKRNMELAQTFRRNGYGYFFVDGSWVENEGTPEEQHVKEDSIFVIGSGEKDNTKLLNLLISVAKKYNQDAFSFKEAGAKSKYKIIDKSGRTVMTFDSVGFNKIASVYTKLRGKKGSFVFETAYTSSGFFARMIKD